MIEEHVKIHDNFSVELKVGFIAGHQEETSDFAMNLWMFIPNSLDINRFTYDKSHFYRDLKSNIRQITPVQKLNELCVGKKSALGLLIRALDNYEAHMSETMKHEFEYHLKMFQSILKSALREEVTHIANTDKHQIADSVELFTQHIREITTQYRMLKERIEQHRLPHILMEYFRFGDEFMSNAIEYQMFRLMGLLRSKNEVAFETSKPQLIEIIRYENTYRQQMDYLVTEKSSESDNHDLVNRLSLLKKYIGGHLYLNLDKRRDGILVEQLLFSLAAGLSMVFATAIAFSFQQRFGSFTMPLFVALVISYMLKDRIKEMARYYFAHKMGTRYFDHKATMHISTNEIGWVKESMHFVAESKIPDKVLKTRDRTTLIEAHNRANSEKILLYRLRMQLDRKKLNHNPKFKTEGVNAIIRFNFSEFIRNMDNPEFNLFVPDAQTGFEIIEGEKLYYINLVIEKQHQNQCEAIRYRIAINRNGIRRIRRY